VGIQALCTHLQFNVFVAVPLKYNTAKQCMTPGPIHMPASKLLVYERAELCFASINHNCVPLHSLNVKSMNNRFALGPKGLQGANNRSPSIAQESKYGQLSEATGVACRAGQTVFGRICSLSLQSNILQMPSRDVAACSAELSGYARLRDFAAIKQAAHHVYHLYSFVQAARAASAKVLASAEIGSSDASFNAQLDEMRAALVGTLESGKTLATRRVSARPLT